MPLTKALRLSHTRLSDMGPSPVKSAMLRDECGSVTPYVSKQLCQLNEGRHKLTELTEL